MYTAQGTPATVHAVPASTLLRLLQAVTEASCINSYTRMVTNGEASFDGILDNSVNGIKVINVQDC